MIFCRLCLKKTELELDENLYKSVFQMLSLCLPEMDLSICYNSALCCLSCLEYLKEIYIFKMQCLHTEEKLRLYLENSDPHNINLKSIMQYVSNLKDENVQICRTCLSSSDSVLVPVELDNDIILKNMFNTCIPELDLELVNNPAICDGCTVLLKKFYFFKSKALQIEDEILTFKEATNTQQVDLVSFLSKQNEGESKELEYVNVDCKYPVDNNNEIKPLDNLLEKEVASQPEDVEDCCKREFDENSTSEFHDLHILKPEINLIEEKGSSNRWNISSDLPKNTFPDDSNLPIRLQMLSNKAANPAESNSKWHTCNVCSYQSKWKHHLERHKQVHEAVSNRQEKGKYFTCLKCGFMSEYKHALLKHATLEHGNWFKCDECDYQTKWKRCYNEHLMKHKGGQTWHQCDMCSYKTKWKYHLKRHMITHQKD